MKFENVNNYKLYVGLNDKDTYTQIIDTDEAEKIAKIIVGELAGGATFSKKQGYWVDEKSNPTTENTLEIMISNCNDDIIETICTTLRDRFNQNCVMIEKSITMVAFI